MVPFTSVDHIGPFRVSTH